jgi:DNA-binding transcriptional LysR family regulator
MSTRSVKLECPLRGKPTVACGSTAEIHRDNGSAHRLPSGKRYRWEFLKQRQEVAIEVPGALTLDNNQLMVEAAIDGLGIAYVPEPYARVALSDGHLVAVLEDWCPPIPGLFLYFHGTRHMPTSLRAFIDMVRAVA